MNKNKETKYEKIKANIIAGATVAVIVWLCFPTLPRLIYFIIVAIFVIGMSIFRK